MSELFDKIINVEFITSDGEVSTKDTILTPDSGRKPVIEVSGYLTGATEIQKINLRITNLYTSKPVSDYKYVRITAGYRGGEQAYISGIIINSYVETPPPDSVTVFYLLQGNFVTWSKAWINRSYDKGTLVRSIFSDFADLLEVYLDWSIDENLVLLKGVNFNCLVQDAIFKMKDLFKSFIVRIELMTLSVSDAVKGTNVLHKVDYVKSAQKNAAGFNIVSLWNPAIKPQDVVELNPKYYKQEIGGNSLIGTKFQVITVNFVMDTRSKNDMSLETVRYEG